MHRVGKIFDWPPLWLAAFLLTSFALAAVMPLSVPFGRIFGMALIFAGLALMLLAVLQMLRARTTVIPRQTATSLVTTGVFRISRNPIYLGDALVLAGTILWLPVVWALPLVALFCWVIQHRFIRGEEAGLTIAFGPEFDLWSRSTRRWIGWAG